MNILFASATPYLPQIYGGVNANTHDLILELQKRGHAASVFARLSYGNIYGARRAASMLLCRQPVRRDTGLGYPVFRTRHPWMHSARVPRHDVVVLQDGGFRQMAEAFHRNTPTLGYFHGLEFEDWDTPGKPFTTADLPPLSYAVNSSFTASRFQRRYGIEAKVVTPVFRPERYRTVWQPRNVTFINPVEEKGVTLALAIAERCPEIPFVFVEGWPRGLRDRLALSRALRGLTNVTLRERTSDMREVYRDCRVLLVPSTWGRETWGRVASEAQISGIPVLGSDIGGLPEAIGEGGEVLSVADPLAAWVDALKRLWHDEAWFRHKSERALAHARRPSICVEHQVDNLVEALEAAVSRHRSGPASAATMRRSRLDA